MAESPDSTAVRRTRLPNDPKNARPEWHPDGTPATDTPPGAEVAEAHNHAITMRSEYAKKLSANVSVIEPDAGRRIIDHVYPSRAAPKPMIRVLKHVEALTRHRDRTLLEVGVASAVFELLECDAVNLFKVQQAGSQTLLHRLAHVGLDGVRYCDTDFELTDTVIALGTRAAFAQCVIEEDIVIEAMAGSTTSSYCLPIGYDGKVAGMLEIIVRDSLTAEAIDLAMGFVNLYSNYLSLLDYSQRDSLTGLLNRRTFNENLNKILDALQPMPVDVAVLPGAERRATHADQPHWLAVIDADHFKRINDDFGHLYGDEALVLIANMMRESFRYEDKLFRFGGEEFVAVLKPATFDDAERALERFREKVEQFHFPQIGQVTISIGFTALRAGDTAASALGAADEALYYAKAHGRNRCCAYHTLVEAGVILPRMFSEAENVGEGSGAR